MLGLEWLCVSSQGRHAKLLAFGLDKDGGQATQLLLSGDGSKPAGQWQAKNVGSVLVDALTALRKQEQWLDPGSVALLRRGQGRQAPEFPMVGL